MFPVRDIAAVLCLLPIVHVSLVGGIVSFGFSLVKEDESLLTSGNALTVRSLLDCSKLCASEPSCCGFNYEKNGRICDKLLLQDMASIKRLSRTGSKIYLDNSCANIFEETTTSSTTSRTSHLTTTEATTSAATAATRLETTSQNTAMSSETTESTPTANTERTTTVTTFSTTTRSVTTTAVISSVVPSTIETAMSTTTTSSSATKTTTTTAATIPSTTANISTCIANALVCTSNKLLVFSLGFFTEFNNLSSLTVGPLTKYNLHDQFPQIHGNIVAAYSSGSALYIVTDDDTVQTYTLDTYSYIKETTIAAHFRTTVSFTFSGTLLNTDSKVYLFNDFTLYTIDSKGNIESTRLDNNGGKNPYKSVNFSDRPTNITAACATDSDTHVFISESNVYTFSFSSQLWKRKGNLVCQ